MLAYVFWHQPVNGVETAVYESSLTAFHRALYSHPPAGFHGSASFAFAGACWAAPGYVDWYIVEDFASLGSLNDAAVAGARQSPHDVVASLAGGGAGGVMRLASERAALDAARIGVWFSKPGATHYGAFRAQISRLADPAGASLWQRQMALGPGPEFCLLAAEPGEIPGEFAPIALELRPVWTPRSASTRNG